MSIVYRPHRGLLADAMAEVKHFSCIEDMIRHVKDDWGRYYSNVDVIVDNTEIDDPRIGWHHTRYVCIKNNSFEFPQCVGMCDLVTFNKEVFF